MVKDTRERFVQAVKNIGGPEKAAHALGCTRSYVDMLCKGPDGKGRERPGMRVAKAIRDRFGISIDDWFENSSQAA